MIDGVISWAEIDLDAIGFNVRAYKRHVGDKVEIIAVVKANAYGHGTVPVAMIALENGANRLAVHRIHEGIELRKAGISVPILIMGYVPAQGSENLCHWDLIPTINTLKTAEVLDDLAGKMGKRMPVHVKMDTGLSRYGLLAEEVGEFIRQVGKLKHVWIEGFYTHFATADEDDGGPIEEQMDIFEAAIEKLRIGNKYYIHAANSAAAMKYRRCHYNAIRPGVGLYGLAPSSYWPPVFEIKPALTLKSRVCRVKDLPAGRGISYGRTYITRDKTRVALVGVGYGDGYHRALSSRGVVLIHGRRAPLLGRVCMDQFVVDVTDIPDVNEDDEAILIGKQGEEQISAEELAGLANTINYEVTTSILPRVLRIYKRGQQTFTFDGTFREIQSPPLKR
jgi:alanine racemase